MSFMRGVKRRIRAAAPTVLFLCIAAYFAFNATRGDLGLRAYAGRQKDLAAAAADLHMAQADRDDWQRRVTALQPAHLDRDALDERARVQLNVGSTDDLVIPVKN